ncbi:glutathione S-transferase family protein [Futiania mangrovi]|uniref:Glutathione S-transferase family protein n=1 Tax=Futiania mangrovi TaxID=2959716 RepID=A0A9J6PG05_9PROT|nr:glutathione S-transferase family protein [Futiania mangrovii]MCP1336731.1 glutathione S-transferase family protein [Futiania mangrovii]
MTRQLYELCGADPERRFSPYCWRSRLALAHKGLEAEVVPWRFTEADRLAFANSDKVPVLVDDDRVVADSWAIAEYLEAAYPDRPSLFNGNKAHVRFVIAWTDVTISAQVLRLVICDIPDLLNPEQAAYFRTSREKRMGMPFYEIAKDREARLPAFRKSLAPLRLVLGQQSFVGGDAPDYADYAVFASFMWARVVSPLQLLEEDDPVHAWRERMLDLYDGMARKVPHG